jgi:DNA polymerase I-like protein with 3'-5' exonuclease and polymerase domains
MTTLCFDIESNHYDFDKMHTLHCLAIGNVDGSETTLYVTPSEIEVGLHRLMDADVLVAHNGIKFDIPALQQFYPWFKPTAKIHDTLIMSRLSMFDWYTHTLSAWGKYLKFFKGDYAQNFKDEYCKIHGCKKAPEGVEWEQYCPEMGEYCILDVDLNIKVYNKLINLNHFTWDVYDLESYTMSLMEQQKAYGVGFNVEKAKVLEATLDEHLAKLDAEIHDNPHFKGFYKVTPEFVPKVNRKALGYTKGSPICKLKWEDFKAGSDVHIRKILTERFAWEPYEFTKSGLPSVTTDVLDSLAVKYPELKVLATRFMVSKRLSALRDGKGSWFNSMKDGRIHGSVNSLGTVTFRATHNSPNLGQVPAGGKPYGEECRDLFSHGYGAGWSFMGCDMSGIEFRLLAHYCASFDEGALADMVLNGDIHTHNQKMAGLETRDQAKTFIYALIYGAGDANLGAQLGGGRYKGSKARKTFMTNMPALATLLNRVGNYRGNKDKVRPKAFNNCVKGIDGRHIYVGSAHVTLNYLLQSAGAILSKAWMREFHKLCADQGFTQGEHYAQLLWVHDEVQCAVKDEHAETIGQLCVQAIENVGDQYKLKCPITGKYSVGQSWKDTH